MWLRHPALTGFLSMTLIVLEKRERLIPKGGIETKHSAATTLQLPLMFDALEWRSMVEFRPGHAPQPMAEFKEQQETPMILCFD